MSEVQKHGIVFEDAIIRERTGLSKQEYDSLKENGYTSAFDLVKGLKVDYNASIKSSGSNTINCGDLLRMMNHSEYRLIVGVYKQNGEYKVFNSQYEFFINKDDYPKLWGNMTLDKTKKFVDFVKSIPEGRDARDKSREERNLLQEEAQCKNSLMKINPKVDSKKQRRVQCSVSLQDLINSGISYTKTDINIVVKSDRRKFNNK